MGGRRSGGGGRRPTKSASKPNDPTIRPLEPTLEPPDIQSFDEFDLHPDVKDDIFALGITTPTPIQRLAIGPVLKGRDVIAKAETGTGKTLAFGAPMMSKIDTARRSVLALILAPTRELAEQVFKNLESIGKRRGIKVALVVGGEPLEPQVRAIQAGAQVIVGTPGRIIDLNNKRCLLFPWTEFVVLDEADIMLEIGFLDDVKKILKVTPPERQTLLFSATFPPELLRLAREYTRDPVEVATAAGLKTVDTIKQTWIRVDEEEAFRTLVRIIERSEPDDVFLCFCARRTDADKLYRRMQREPFHSRCLHGGFDQEARFKVMEAFRSGDVKLLVATDVASRGLDVKAVSHVVNWNVPQDTSDYTHRIGRTGRAGRRGNAITIVKPEEFRKWTRILDGVTWEIEEVMPPGRTPRGMRADAPREFEAPRAPERRPPTSRSSTERQGEEIRRPSERRPTETRAPAEMRTPERRAPAARISEGNEARPTERRTSAARATERDDVRPAERRAPAARFAEPRPKDPTATSERRPASARAPEKRPTEARPSERPTRKAAERHEPTRRGSGTVAPLEDRDSQIAFLRSIGSKKPR